MPEAADIPTVQTSLQQEIVAKTTAAVQDTGFDAAFDAEVDAALAKDGKRDAPKDASPKTPAKQESKSEPKADIPILDIPESLLGKKEKASGETKVSDATDPDREKFIKEQTAGMSTKAADRFRAIEAKAYAAEQKAIKAEKLEKELAQAQERLKSAVDSSAVESYKKQLEELDGIVQKNAIAEHPRFKARFDAQIAAEVSTAVKFAPKEAASEVEALLSLPETAQRNRRLNEIAGEIENDLEAHKFRDSIAKADRLSSERAGELANWKVNKTRLAELTEQEKQQAVEHRSASIKKALDTVIPRFTDDEKGVEIFRKVEGNDEWNRKVDERLSNVRKLTETDLGREDIAEMAAWATSGQEYRKMFLTQRVLVQRLQEEIAALKGGEPDLGTGSSSTGGDEESGSMIDSVTRIAQKMGAVR